MSDFFEIDFLDVESKKAEMQSLYDTQSTDN